MGCGWIYLPAVLAEQYPEASAIPASWLKNLAALRLAVGTQSAAGQVKLSTVAYERARGTAFLGMLDGWNKAPDALALAFIFGVALVMKLPVPE
jgi:hypothetical protein